jgi:hypothetical protein
VALALVQRGVHRGPLVLLAPAHRHFGVEETIPEGGFAVIVHGLEDDVVSIEGSRALSRTGQPGQVTLLEVHDGHRLGSLLEGEALADLVRKAATGRAP